MRHPCSERFGRGKGRSKRLSAAIVAGIQPGPAAPSIVETGRRRNGRNGVATAAFSLRERPERAQGQVLGPSICGMWKGVAARTRSLTKVRILLSFPCFETLCTATPTVPTRADASEWRHGVRPRVDGLNIVTATRTRLFTSRVNGIIRCSSSILLRVQKSKSPCRVCSSFSPKVQTLELSL
jgi:hypothetical protein